MSPPTDFINTKKIFAGRRKTALYSEINTIITNDIL